MKYSFWILVLGFGLPVIEILIIFCCVTHLCGWNSIEQIDSFTYKCFIAGWLVSQALASGNCRLKNSS